MCLTVINKFKTRQQARDFAKQPLIATKDISVFKILKRETCFFSGEFQGYSSPYRSMIYERNQEYSVPNFKSNTQNNYKSEWRLNISSGLHAYTSEYVARQLWEDEIYDKTHLLVKMYIPKGALYFIGEDKEIVSTKLIFKPLK